jgi:uncharacterized protein with FMN-binding domain
MRRSVLSLFGLILGAIFLVVLKTPSFGTTLSGIAGAPQNPGTPQGGASGLSGPGPGQASGPIPSGPAGPGQTPKPGTSPGQPGVTSRPGQNNPTPGRSTATTPPAGGTTTTAPPTKVTVTGAAIAVRTAEAPTARSSPCGNCANYSISVTITVTNGRITSTTVSYNPSPGESQLFANQANSQLSQSILTAQTWNLGRVSGATYAGNAWEQSARDAMSKAGLPV